MRSRGKIYKNKIHLSSYPVNERTSKGQHVMLVMYAQVFTSGLIVGKGTLYIHVSMVCKCWKCHNNNNSSN